MEGGWSFLEKIFEVEGQRARVEGQRARVEGQRVRFEGQSVRVEVQRKTEAEKTWKKQLKEKA